MISVADFCAETNNYFEKTTAHELQCYSGTFTIENGAIDLSSLPVGSVQEGQYIRIFGSTFNDGVWHYPVSPETDNVTMTDETFTGSIWAMRVPPRVIALIGDINAFLTDGNNSSVLNSPYSSESFGGYSYSKSAGTGDGKKTSWVDWLPATLSSRLNEWRKLP